MRQFFSKGKLMLTGEYGVLHGASAICQPLATGQELLIWPHARAEIVWRWRYQDTVLADFTFDARSLKLLLWQCGNEDWARSLLMLIRNIDPTFLNEGARLEFINYFPPDWGLGTSSACISSLCRAAAGVDPFEVNTLLGGGSGADIACTLATAPFLYRRVDGTPHMEPINRSCSQCAYMWLVYSGKKQPTASHLKSVDTHRFDTDSLAELNLLSQAFFREGSLNAIQEVIARHEKLIARTLQLEPLSAQFPDFAGVVKSLGAWGGDFFLAVSALPEDDVRSYFRRKGYAHCYAYESFVAQQQF